MTVYTLIKRLLIVLAVVLSGCAASVLNSQKVGAPVADVSRINVIFLGTKTGPQHDLGLQVAEKFPKILAENGIASDARNVVRAEIPDSRAEYRQLFGKGNGGALILLVTPLSSTQNCNGSCVSAFKVRAELIRAGDGSLYWTALMGLPFPETRWAGYSGVAEKFAATLLGQLRTDGVLPPKQ